MVSSSISRRAARELAFQYLFSSSETAGVTPSETQFRAFCENFEKMPSEGDPFAWEIISGASAHMEDLDKQIHAISKNWRIERMPRIDLTILRLATYEILYRTDVPKSVSINEAVELAKKFGAEGTPAFVNGILDKIQKPGV